MGEVSTSALTDEFRRRCVHHMREEYLPRIERACARLDGADLWWRPNASCTSVGNLLLHLEGNVRQWILAGLDGREDERERAGEFAALEGSTVNDLLRQLRATVEDACGVIEQLEPDAMLEVHDIQVFEGVTAMAAVLHVVEHFSWHTGQIAWIAKMRTARDLGFYDDSELN